MMTRSKIAQLTDETIEDPIEHEHYRKEYRKLNGIEKHMMCFTGAKIEKKLLPKLRSSFSKRCY